MKTSAMTCARRVWLAALLVVIAVTVGCEDDPRDLDYLDDAGADGDEDDAGE